MRARLTGPGAVPAATGVSAARPLSQGRGRRARTGVLLARLRARDFGSGPEPRRIASSSPDGAAPSADDAKRYRVTRSTGEVQMVTREEMEALHRAHVRRIARAERLAWLIVRGPQLLGLVLLVVFLRSCVFAGEEAAPAYYGSGPYASEAAS